MPHPLDFHFSAAQSGFCGALRYRDCEIGLALGAGETADFDASLNAKA